MNKKDISFIVLLSGLFLVLLTSISVDQPVTFEDKNLENAIRHKLNYFDKPIFRSQLLNIVEIDLSNKDISDLAGIEYMRNLEVINLRHNNIYDVSRLSTLKNLRILNLGHNRISDLNEANLEVLTNNHIIDLNLDNNNEGRQYLSEIQALRGFINLQRLSLANNHINDILPLSGLKELKFIDLANNNIEELTGLAGLTNLEKLDLRKNQITNIYGIENLNKLNYLNLRENYIKDISPIKSLDNLEYLNLHSNKDIEDISYLRNLPEVRELILRNVHIGENYEFLRSMRQLYRLNLRSTSISDLSIIGELMHDNALQDDQDNNVLARVNLLNINLSDDTGDPYSFIRDYWDNISNRYPLELPYYSINLLPPVFSHSGGFYDNNITLHIYSQETCGDIYYTTDGSKPSITKDFQKLGSTKIYTNPILITDRSYYPNYLSKIETHKLPDYDYFPQSEVFKGTVIRAMFVDDSGKQSNVISNTYFVNENIHERYSFPIISISTDPEYLFDDDLGIYVPGNLYEDLQKSWHIPFYPANFTQRGLMWERPASFEMFSPLGERIISRHVGIRIHGGATRSYPQKSLRLYFTVEYGSEGYLHYDLFPELSSRYNSNYVDKFQTLILRNAGNDWYGTMFRDALAQNLLLSTNLDIQGNFPVIVFINGEYWGIHNLRTRYDAFYFKNYYGIDIDDLLVLIEFWGQTQIGRTGERETYFAMLRMIDERYSINQYETVATLSDQDAYVAISELMDTENFSNYFISQIYFANTDWPHNNIMYWRKLGENDKNPEYTQYGHDGKWRWIIYDTDFAFINVYHDSLSHATTDREWSTYLFRSLLENQEYKLSFINTFADHLNTTFREEIVIEQINRFQNIYEPEIEEQIHRWNNLGGSVNSWLENVEGIREFARLRPTIQREHIVDYFDLSGTAHVTTSVNPNEGFITINSIDIIDGTTGVADPADWTGIYFQEVPITITATPYDGYQFSHWEGEGIDDATKETITITLETDLQITAYFSIQE